MSARGGRPPLAASTPNHTIASSSTSHAKKSFVFGSSTPRELSHINKVSRKARLISSGSQPLDNSDKEDQSKRGPGISYYMRQARSITPAGPRGSSTPREFSHLKNIRADQRVYDAKINHKPDAKSVTTSYISDKPSSLVKPQSSGSKLLMGNHIAKSGRLSDDASSEPDIVQDRAIDFHRKAAAAIKIVKETGSKDKKAAKASNKAAKESSPKKNKESAKSKSTDDKKTKKSVEKKGKVEKKSPLDEKFQELSTETGQKLVLLDQTHEDSTNEKAVRVPSVRAHDDASEVLLDDEELAAAPSEAKLAAVTDHRKEENSNVNSAENNSKSTLNSGNNEARTLSPLQETQDSGRST